MVDATANARQHRRIARLASDGLMRSTVLVHSGCRQVLQELRPYLVDPGQSGQLFDLLRTLREQTGPVNVSQVPQLSPLRYPGGKTWLVPEVKRWLKSLDMRPALFIEPFAGGAITGLSVAAESLAGQTILAELDPSVAALWVVLIHGSDIDAESLITKVLEFQMTHEQVTATLAGYAASQPQRAFTTILKNRVNRGGILAPGASMMKSGENGKGLSSRWYPQTLVNRMRGIRAIRHRLQFIEGDAFSVIKTYRHRKTAAWFIDPPYTAGGKKAGSRLYLCNEIDHERLFTQMAACAGPVLMTYDDAPEVRSLAHRSGFSIREVPMKTTHHEVKNELLLVKP